ncbi:hypothetical protein ABK040_014234 [Willaertia magna]
MKEYEEINQLWIPYSDWKMECYISLNNTLQENILQFNNLKENLKENTLQNNTLQENLKENLEIKNLILYLNGIDTFCKIYINDQFILQTDNQFQYHFIPIPLNLLQKNTQQTLQQNTQHTLQKDTTLQQNKKITF